MLRYFFAIILFLSILKLEAQNGNSAQLADYTRFSIPRSQSNTTSQIADYIKKNFKTDDEKVWAAYSWVTSNIKYDKDSLHRVISEESADERVTFAMRRRKGVCENFAAIFADICKKANIESFFIEGLSREGGGINKQPHAWNAAKIDNEWFLFDPTWDAGLRAGNFRYFKIAPADFISSHYPYDPLFQFLYYPVNFSDLSRGLSAGKIYFNYMDSIKLLQSSDSLSRFRAQLSRINNNGFPKSIIDIKRKQLILEIEMIFQDDDVINYNSAVADFNSATNLLNDFIYYRNAQFLPAKNREEVQGNFDEIKRKINSANKKLEKVNASSATLYLNTGDIQQKLDDLSRKANEQEVFFKNYLTLQKENQ
jgi:predicted DNA-binding ArsR family transcriptional regulator